MWIDYKITFSEIRNKNLININLHSEIYLNQNSKYMIESLYKGENKRITLKYLLSKIHNLIS